MPSTPETRAMVLAAAQVCEDKKGIDVRILELDAVDAGLSDYFLIASGSNTRQTGAMADDIELRLKRDFGTYAHSVEGHRKGDWIVLDYVDFVVHLFTPETREFYDIERLRKSARAVDKAELSMALQPKSSTGKRAAVKKGAGTPKKEPSAAKASAKRRAPGTAEASPTKRTAGRSTSSDQQKPVKSRASAKKTSAKKTATKKAPAKRSPVGASRQRKTGVDAG